MSTIRRNHFRPITTSIAAMTYNQPELINTLAEELSPYLLVVDNGSTPPIAPPSRYAYHVLRVPENRYFAGGWNYAMNFIQAKWVVMLNDDIIGITLEMIDDLIESAEVHDYAVISPAFNSPHDSSQPHGIGLHRVHSIDWVAPIIRKDAWDAVGGFNAEAFSGWGSELDIAYRLKQQGYRMAIDDRHIIHHIGGVAAWNGGTTHIQNNVAKMNESFKRLYGINDWAQFVQQFLSG